MVLRYKDNLFNNQEFAIISFILVTFMSDSAVKLLIGRNLALLRVNPLSLTSDQDRISPYIISTISSRQVIRIKKNIIRVLLVDPIPNSPNYHHINCMADSKENYLWNLGNLGVKVLWFSFYTRFTLFSYILDL